MVARPSSPRLRRMRTQVSTSLLTSAATAVSSTSAVTVSSLGLCIGRRRRRESACAFGRRPFPHPASVAAVPSLRVVGEGGGRSRHQPARTRSRGRSSRPSSRPHSWTSRRSSAALRPRDVFLAGRRGDRSGKRGRPSSCRISACASPLPPTTGVPVRAFRGLSSRLQKLRVPTLRNQVSV